MKILVYLGHPAHFHNYKNTIAALKAHGHQVEVLIKKKDILEDLLKEAGIPYHNILEEGRSNSKAGIFLGLLKRAWRLNRFCRSFMPDLLTGSSVIEKIFGIPGIGRLMITAIQENDYNVTIACAFVYSLMYIVTMLFVDILYGVIDPRIRIAKEED